MNANQQMFCDEYLRNGRNATKAYMTAYPGCKSETSAGACATKLLKNALISEYISSKLKAVSSAKIMSVAEIMENLSSIARGDASEQTVTNRGEIVETSMRASDRIQAMKTLAKMLGVDNGLAREVFEHEKAKAEEASGDINVTVNL